MIEYGYKRPTDRPSVAYCRVCGESPTTYAIGGVCGPLPLNLAGCFCGKCRTAGSTVWIEPKKKVWKPLCGNPDCTGTCTVLECIPPREEESTKVVKVPWKFDINSYYIGVVTAFVIDVAIMLLKHYWPY